VGDDIGEVVRSFEGSPVPVLTADTTGFKGNNLWGHSQVLRALADRFLEPAREVSPLQVNILGIVPYYDSFWEGTLEGIETLLRRIGLQPNIFYGRGRSLDDFRKIPAAAANLVIGPWVDLEFAEDLKDRFGTPVLHFSHLPIGPTETAKFVRFLVSFFELDQPAVDGYLTSEDEHYYYFIQRALAYTYGCKVLPKEFIINASASAALAMTKYLVNDLGLIPHKIYIPEDVPDRYQEAVHGYFQDLEWDHEVEVVFTNDGGFAETEIRAENFINKPMIFGSLFEEAMAIDLQMNFVPISAPLGNFLVFDKSYLGYRGALDLYSDVYSQVLAVGD
jgi:nitrogenase molybdenum-iron protein beta chain